jgi:hypothetical protein
MSRGKKHTPEQFIAKLRQIDKMKAEGATVVKRLGITEQSLNRWRNQFGAMSKDEAARLKLLEQENGQLRKEALSSVVVTRFGVCPYYWGIRIARASSIRPPAEASDVCASNTVGPVAECLLADFWVRRTHDEPRRPKWPLPVLRLTPPHEQGVGARVEPPGQSGRWRTR